MKSDDAGMEMGHLDIWTEISSKKNNSFYMIQVTMFGWYHGKSVWLYLQLKTFENSDTLSQPIELEVGKWKKHKHMHVKERKWQNFIVVEISEKQDVWDVWTPKDKENNSAN